MRIVKVLFNVQILPLFCAILRILTALHHPPRLLTIFVLYCVLCAWMAQVVRAQGSTIKSYISRLSCE